MLFKKKNKDSHSLQPSHAAEAPLGRSKSLFAKQIDVPTSNIDFGFQHFSSEAPLPPREDFSSSLQAEPSFVEPATAVLPPVEAPVEFDEPPVIPNFPPEPSFTFEPEPEIPEYQPAELTSDLYTLPPLTLGETSLAAPNEIEFETHTFEMSPAETHAFEVPILEEPSFEEAEPVPALEWGKEMPGIVDVSHTDITFPEAPQPIHTPEEMHLASDTMPPFSSATLSGPSIDDFWVHYAPGFEEAVNPSNQANPEPVHNAAEFLDSVHHQLYPVQEPSAPRVEEPLEEASNATDSWDYPSFSLDLEEEPEPVASPDTPAMSHVFEEQAHSAETAVQNPLSIGLEDLEVLALQPLDVDKTLLMVSLQGTYALMGQLHGEISVLKLFPYNPLGGDNETFTVSREGSIGNQALYHVQLGYWQAVLKADPQSIALHTEL